MYKIITAIGNENLNERLKQEKKFMVYEHDVVYKEAIIEILEKDNSYNFVIINESLEGEISWIELINKIKQFNKLIKIIFILEYENELIEKLLIERKIDKVFYNKEININEFINYLINDKKSEEELKNEINELKKEIKKNKQELLKYRQKYDKGNELNSKRGKIISITGIEKSGKTIISYLLANKLKFKQILIIDFNFLEATDFRNIIYQKNSNLILKKINSNINNKKRYILKINKKINILFDLKKMLESKKNDLKKLLSSLINRYDLIIVDLDINNYYKDTFFNLSDRIYILIEADVKVIKSNRKLLDEILLNNDENKINLIINKYNRKSIDCNLIKKILNYEISEIIKEKSNQKKLIKSIRYKNIYKQIKKINKYEEKIWS